MDRRSHQSSRSDTVTSRGEHGDSLGKVLQLPFLSGNVEPINRAVVGVNLMVDQALLEVGKVLIAEAL